MPDTPENTATLEAMETPQTLTEDEMTDARYSYDLPKTDDPDGPREDNTEGTADLDADDASRAPEEDSQSEIPGDPRAAHQTQPPTSEQY